MAGRREDKMPCKKKSKFDEPREATIIDFNIGKIKGYIGSGLAKHYRKKKRGNLKWQ